jgi:type VI protein secretion system component Hcp
MNNEPVAYGMLTFCKNCGEQNPYPAKTLTDEEIIRIADSIVINDRTLGNFSIDFARAILKKASEK